MKIANIIKSTSLAALTMLAACTGDFLEKNTNPNEATDEMLNWDNLRTGSAFAQMTKNIIPVFQLIGSEEYGNSRYQVIQDLCGNIFSGYTGAVKGGWAGNNVYNITAQDWHNYMFNDAFTQVIAPWVNIDSERAESPVVAALADVLKVAVMHRVTDTYGPVPYSAISGDGSNKPYDPQQKIYTAFFDELDAAIKVLTEYYDADPSATLLANYDNVFYGNVRSWIKFANTLRLRLALRVYYADAALAKKNAEAAVSHSVGVMTASGDLARLNKPAEGIWKYPLYEIQYEYNGGDSRIGATIECYMNGYEDPRRGIYFTRNSEGEYRGVRNGVSLSGTAYANSDKLSAINCGPNDPMVWMTPAEAYFLRAEGAMRGWTMGDTAENLYNEGIRVSFATLGASGADSYLANDTNKPAAFVDKVSSNNAVAPSTITIKWSETATVEQKLERIITQKYIAMFPDGQEAWSEFRRTGYPKVFPVVTNSSGGVINTATQIRRINYPKTEYTANAEFVAAAVATLGSEAKSGAGDNGGTKLWWDKK